MAVSAFVVLLIVLVPLAEAGITRYYDFNVTFANATRLCHTKSIVTVNGQYPGPEIHVNEGDKLVIKLWNQINANVTLHWHGIFQNRTAWFDGPEYITQCPLQPGTAYTYKFVIHDQRGTLWWHAHIPWMRATVHGALIIHPRPGVSFPFAKPHAEVPIILGDWWNDQVQDVLDRVLASGSGPDPSDAFTINSQPGLVYNCSARDAFVLEVESGKNYLLRIINAGLNTDLFFGIGGHNLTVVEADACYVKPFSTNVLHISPGQTINVLLNAGQAHGDFFMAARAYFAPAGNVPFDETTATGILRYRGGGPSSPSPLSLPWLPAYNDTDCVMKFNRMFRSLDSRSQVPLKPDKYLLFPFGLNLMDCPPGAPMSSCQGGGGRFSASVNNISFVPPVRAVLDAHYHGRKGVFGNLLGRPAVKFDYTGVVDPLLNANAIKATDAFTVAYGTTIQLVMQGTSLVAAEGHPIHLHGYNFYVMGQGFGNYDPSLEKTFNFVDPPMRNTIGIPPKGWTAIRFIADNPGTWFFHCHFDIHTTWGLGTVLRVLDGQGPLQSLEPPPKDYPPC